MATTPACSPKLFRTLVLSTLLVLAADPVARRLGLTYWQPGINAAAPVLFALQQSGVRPDILFLGSSKMRNLILPRRVESTLQRRLGRPVLAYVAAQPGTTILTSASVLREIVRTNGCPALVVLEVTPGTFGRHNRSVPRDLESYLLPGDLWPVLPEIDTLDRLDGALSGLLRGYLNLWLAMRHPPGRSPWNRILERTLESRRGGLSRHPPGGRVHSVAGWPPKGAAAQLARALARDRHELLTDYSLGRAARRALASISEQTSRCHGRLLLLQPPVHPRLRRALGEREQGIFQTWVLAFAAARAPDVTFLRLQPEELGLTDEDFGDFSHLNSRGAHRATNYLAGRVLLPALAARNGAEASFATGRPDA